jgi:hypothetical protein
MKDLNFTEINRDIDQVQFEKDDADFLECIIGHDAHFLSSHDLMDYSLLFTTEQVRVTTE